jgi:hypothetical protein
MSAVTLRTAQAPLRRLASRSSSSPSFTRISIPSIAARTKLLHPQLLRPTVAGAAQFSTKPALMSSAPPPSGPREYDPEIKDMASYIHNYKIDSDLAVHSHVISIISSVLNLFSSTLPASSSWTPWAAASRLSVSKNAPSSSGLSSKVQLFPMARECQGRPTYSIP